jgi:hypothetical protein
MAKGGQRLYAEAGNWQAFNAEVDIAERAERRNCCLILRNTVSVLWAQPYRCGKPDYRGD